MRLCKVSSRLAVPGFFLAGLVGALISSGCADDAPPPTPGQLGAKHIRQSKDLWWFRGERPRSYATQVTLTTIGLKGGSFAWSVIVGQNKVDLAARGKTADALTVKGATTIDVKSTSPSKGAATVTPDVTIQLVHNNKTYHHKLAVFAPSSLSALTPIDRPYKDLRLVNPRYPNRPGYWSLIAYEIQDQFGRPLPYDVPWNEDFNKDGRKPFTGTSDFAGENWPWARECGWVVKPRKAEDNLTRCDPPATRPPAKVPQTPLLNVKVDHVVGAWYVGNKTIGKGVLVKDNCKWQMYQDHGRHE